MTFYTRTGDDGTTGLLGEGRVPKTHPRIEALGALDESTATLGWARAHARDPRSGRILLESQRDLYKLMAATESEYTQFRNGKVGRTEVGEGEPPDVSASFQDFVAGAWVREKFNEMMKDSEDRLRAQEEKDRSRRKI